MPAAICLCHFMPYYVNDDESHFVPRNPRAVDKGRCGLYCAKSWFDIELLKGRGGECFQSSLKCRVRKLNETHFNPLASLWLALENEAWSCNKCSGARRPHPRCALFLKRPTWRFDESYFSRCLTMSIFSVCVSVCFSLRTQTLSCGISVESRNGLIQPLSLNVAERRCMYV